MTTKTNTSHDTKRLIQQLHALEAQVKASRMAAEALLREQLIAEAADRAVAFSLDESFVASCEPDWDDQWEIDQWKLGADLVHRVIGGEQ